MFWREEVDCSNRDCLTLLKIVIGQHHVNKLSKKWQLVELSSNCMCDINPNFSSYRGVHHFLYLKYCPAVNIFQNFCQPVAIWAVIHFWSKSTTSRKQFVSHLLQTFVIFFFTRCHFFDIWSTPQSCVGCCQKERNRRSVNLGFCPWFVICPKLVLSTVTFPNLFSFKLWLLSPVSSKFMWKFSYLFYSSDLLKKQSPTHSWDGL